MEHPARMARQPGAYPRVLVDGIVVHDRVYDLAGRDCCLDGVEKADEFLMTVALHAATEHRAVEHVQGRKQRGRAMPLVVMRHGRGAARADERAGSGTAERLDLALLVDGQDDSVRGWAHVEPDNVLHLLGKRRRRTRWGSTRWARQIRWIVRSARPTRSATARPVQCVTSPGGSEQVMARTWATVSGGTGALPGGRVLSRSSPSTPSSAKRCCQRHTAGRLTPTRFAICSTGRRSPAHRMMRARWTCLCGRFRSATRAVRRSRSPALRRMLEVWAMRPRLAHLRRTVNPQIASVH